MQSENKGMFELIEHACLGMVRLQKKMRETKAERNGMFLTIEYACLEMVGLLKQMGRKYKG